jgi:hypothetical protein
MDAVLLVHMKMVEDGYHQADGDTLQAGQAVHGLGPDGSLVQVAHYQAIGDAEDRNCHEEEIPNPRQLKFHSGDTWMMRITKVLTPSAVNTTTKRVSRAVSHPRKSLAMRRTKTFRRHL